MIITSLDLKLRPCMPCLQKAKTLSCKHTEEEKEKVVNTQHTLRLVQVFFKVVLDGELLFKTDLRWSKADVRWFTDRLNLEVEGELNRQLFA